MTLSKKFKQKKQREGRSKELAERFEYIAEGYKFNKLIDRKNEIIFNLVQGKIADGDCDLTKELKEIEEQISKYIVHGQDGKTYLNLRKKKPGIDWKEMFDDLMN